MSRHEQLVDAAEKAITELFGDKSVSLDRTLEDLLDLENDINTMVDALRDDLKRSGAA